MTTQIATLAVAHLDAINIDVLVTTWSDGTGEVAYRQGQGQTSVRWSAPVPLEVAP
jgi:hypothetical protein